MRGVAVAALLTVASCSNLQTSMEGMLKTIDGMKFTGKSRASGAAEARVDQVSQFLREVKESNKIAPTAMDNIVTLINNLFPGFATARDDDQATLNNHQTRWDACHNPTSRNLAEAKYTDSLTKRDEHDECRNQERGLFTDDDTACTTVFTALSAKRDVGCEDFPAVDRDNGDAWELAITAINGWFEEMTTYVENNFGSCENSGSAWADKKADCDNNKQVSLETTACAYCSMMEGSCSDESTCYDNVETDYATAEATVFEAAGVRISQVAVLKFLVCVMGEVKAAADDASMAWDDINAACQDQLAASNWVAYNNTPWVAGARESCSVIEERCPSHANWYDDNYKVDHGNGFGIAHQATSPVPVLTSC